MSTPDGGTTTYSQAPVFANGVLFLLAQRVVEGANHAVLVALNVPDGAELDAWDLGAGGREYKGTGRKSR